MKIMKYFITYGGDRGTSVSRVETTIYKVDTLKQIL